MRTLACAVLGGWLAGGCASAAKPAPVTALADAGPDATFSGPLDAEVDQGAAPADLLLRGARLPGGVLVDVEIRSGKIVSVRPAGTSSTAPIPSKATLDLTGRWLAPAFVDSHVHLTYWDVGDRLVTSGVVAAVDLAAPESSLSRPTSSPLRLLSSGPMITTVQGYPLDSWGSDGYGIEVETPAQAITAVDRLVDAGAAVIKLPLGQGRALPEAVAGAAITRAHERGRKVAVHALTDASAALAARLGADVLAHTPVEPLSAQTVQAWRGRAVISTLAAFGGSDATLANLRALRAAGVTVIYGTDLGNTRDPRIDPREIDLLQQAGIKGAALLETATSAPARFWGLDDLGSIAPGKAASLLVLDADPLLEPATLASPVQVIVQGLKL